MEGDGLYFYRRGRQVPVELNGEVWSLRGPWRALDVALARLPYSVRVLYQDERAGVLVVRGAERDVRRVVGDRVALHRAYRLAGGAPGSFLAPNGRVFVRFPAAASPDRVNAMLGAVQARVVERVDEMPNGYFVAVKGNVLDVARRLVEDCGAESAEPDWVQPMTLRSR